MKTTAELMEIQKRLYTTWSTSKLFKNIAKERYADAVAEADKDMSEENIQQVITEASKLLGAIARCELDSEAYRRFKANLIIKGGYSQEEVEGWAR